MTGTAAEAGVQERLALRPGVHRGRAAGGAVYLLSRTAGEPVGHLDPQLVAALDELAAAPRTRTELAARLGRPPRNGDVGSLDTLLDLLQERGWLATTVSLDGAPQYTVLPHRSPPDRPPPPPPDLVLSRFVVVRRVNDHFVAESARGWCEIHVHDPALLVVLAGPPEPAERPESPRTTAAGSARAMLLRRLWEDLWWGGLAVPAGEEHAQWRFRQWATHDLWFHQRTRTGRRELGEAFGGTFWASGKFAPLPARADPYPGPAVALDPPDLQRLRAVDPPLTAVLEDRCSVRESDDSSPMTVQQLGELLYRCNRNRRTETRHGMEYLSRPYPSGGSYYELEIYPVVRQVAGLAAGMYHYDPECHRLEQVCGTSPPVRRLLRDAAAAMATGTAPQLLLVIAARFGRIMWTYQEIPYALILRNTGVLYQTIYLVASAMGLATCGLGVSDPDAFADATGRDPLAESSVGELALGGATKGHTTGGDAPVPLGGGC